MAKETYLGLRGRKLQHAMLALLVFPSYASLGYNNVAPGGLVTLHSFITQFPQTDTVTTTGPQKAQNARVEGTVVALYLVGAMIGALSTWRLGDHLGRLRTTMVGACLLIVGWILECSSFALGQLIVGRLLVGMGTGAISATVPIWQSECSPATHRGSIVVLEGLFASIGIAISQWLELGFFFVPNSASWRFPLAFPIIFGFVILGAAPFLPESPRWLVKKGRIEEARHITSILEESPEDSEHVSEIISKMQYSLSLMKNASFKDLLKNGEDRILNRTLVAMFSTCAQQMSGIAVTGFYTDTILEEFLGFNQIQARIMSGSLYMLQIFCSIGTYFAVDRLGRRKLMMIGIGGMGSTVAIMAGTTSRPDSKACAVISTLCLFLFTSSFGFGSLGVNYLYGAEIAPLAYRVPIYALTATTLWSFNFLSVEVSPVAFASLGNHYFIIYAVIDLCLLLPIIFFFLPETRGLSLEDIDAIFRNAKNPFQPVKTARKLAAQAHPLELREYEKAVEAGTQHVEKFAERENKTDV